MMSMLRMLTAAAVLVGMGSPAPAQDTLKIAIGQRGGWEQ
jgi:hypothetical protein